MTTQDIDAIIAKLSKTLATKEDITMLDHNIQRLEIELNRLDSKIEKFSLYTKFYLKQIDNNVDTVLSFAEEVDKATTDHEKRLNNIEAIPVIAHELRKP